MVGDNAILNILLFIAKQALNGWMELYISQRKIQSKYHDIAIIAIQTGIFNITIKKNTLEASKWLASY